MDNKASPRAFYKPAPILIEPMPDTGSRTAPRSGPGSSLPALLLLALVVRTSARCGPPRRRPQP